MANGGLSQLTNLPPQATGASLPGRAQAAGVTGPPPVEPLDITALLRDSNFGDGANERIQALQAAAPAPAGGGQLAALAGGAPTRPAGGAASLAASGPLTETSPAGTAEAPQAPEDPVRTLQNIGLMRISFMKSLKDQQIPIPARAKIIMDSANRMGRQSMTPAQAELVARMFDGRDLALAEQRIKDGDVPFLLKIGHDLPDTQSYLSLGDDMQKAEATVQHQRSLASLGPSLAAPPPAAAPTGLESLAGVKKTAPQYNLAQDIAETFLSGDPNKYTAGLAAQQQKSLAAIEAQQKIATTIRDNYKGLYDDAKEIMANYPRGQWEGMIAQRAAERGVQANPSLVIGTRAHASADEAAAQALDNHLAGAPLPELHGLGMDPMKQADFMVKVGKIVPTAEAEEQRKAAAEKVFQAGLPKSPADIAARQVAGEGLTPGAPEYGQRVAALTAQLQAQGELAKAKAGASPSALMTNRADAITQLQNEGTIPPTTPNLAPYLPQINERASVIAANQKAPSMTIQRAREQIAATKDVAADLGSMLVDPKYATAIKSLGPSLTTTIGGATIGLPTTEKAKAGLPSYNRAWANYRNYGGKGNTPEENRVMQAVAYFQGTGFQGLLAGIRNPRIIDDIRAHLPTPLADADENLARIQYLDQRYNDVLAEFAKGAQPIGGAGARGTAPTRVQTPADAAALTPGTRFITPDGQVRVRK